MATNRSVLVTLVALLVGLFTGGALVALLSARASHLYLQMTRLRLASEVEDQTRLALKRGDLPSAELFASCAIVVESDTAAFDPLDSHWEVSFPVMGLWTSKKAMYPVKDRRPLVALAHARLGVVLERMGRNDDAQREFRAAAAGSARDPSQWRQAGMTILDR